MWEKSKKFKVNANSDKLFTTVSDLQNWDKWDKGIKQTKVEGEIKEGCKFSLETQEGQVVDLKLVKLVPNKEMVDVAFLPDTQMFTTHTFNQIDDNNSEIIVTVRLEGKGVEEWKWLGEEQINTLDKQIEDLTSYVNKL